MTGFQLRRRPPWQPARAATVIADRIRRTHQPGGASVFCGSAARQLNLSPRWIDATASSETGFLHFPIDRD
jgi:hypothetical protein